LRHAHVGHRLRRIRQQGDLHVPRAGSPVHGNGGGNLRRGAEGEGAVREGQQHLGVRLARQVQERAEERSGLDGGEPTGHLRVLHGGGGEAEVGRGRRGAGRG
ncbi:unnamed protein product, partial [Ectocarpus fasciculatus]